MDEEQWLASTDPQPMLEFLRGKASERKLRLFAVACCRRIWPFLHSSRSRRVVELLEDVADGFPSETELRVAAEDARAYADSDEGRAAEIGCSAAYAAVSTTESYPGEWAGWTASRTAECVGDTRYWVAYEAEAMNGGDEQVARRAGEAAKASEAIMLAAMLRDIVGNPFHPLTLDTSLLTDSVLKLAAAIYEDHAFDRMPVLADALEECGATDSALLGHLRGPGPHARGCHVLDLILSKS